MRSKVMQCRRGNKFLVIEYSADSQNFAGLVAAAILKHGPGAKNLPVIAVEANGAAARFFKPGGEVEQSPDDRVVNAEVSLA